MKSCQVFLLTGLPKLQLAECSTSEGVVNPARGYRRTIFRALNFWNRYSRGRGGTGLQKSTCRNRQPRTKLNVTRVHWHARAHVHAHVHTHVYVHTRETVEARVESARVRVRCVHTTGLQNCRSECPRGTVSQPILPRRSSRGISSRPITIRAARSLSAERAASADRPQIKFQSNPPEPLMRLRITQLSMCVSPILKLYFFHTFGAFCTRFTWILKSPYYV